MFEAGQIIEINGMKFFVSSVVYNGFFKTYADGEKTFYTQNRGPAITHMELRGVKE